MLLKIIFVHFSLLSLSFADNFANVGGRATDTRGYSSEWQFRGNFINVDPTFNPDLTSTSEKVIQYANGWRPIPSSKSLFREREPKFKSHRVETMVKIGGYRENVQPRRPWRRNPDRGASSEFPPLDFTRKMLPISPSKNQYYPFLFVKPTLPNVTNISPQIRFNSYPNERATNIVENLRLPVRQKVDRREKSKKVMKEDDIMWMYYQTLDQVPKAQPLTNNDLPEARQIDQYDTDMMMQETQDSTSPFIVYSNPTGIAEQTLFPTENIFTTHSTPRPYYSRNSYEVIDKNNKDNFKPMTSTESTTKREGTKRDEGDKTPQQNFQNVFYDADGDRTAPTTEYNPILQQLSDSGTSTGIPIKIENIEKKEYVNADSKRNRRLFNSTKSENISQDYAWPKKLTNEKRIKMLGDESNKVSGKYFSKPIVITESETTPEGEYFKQLLYDSFGGSNHNDREIIDDDDDVDDANISWLYDENKITNSTETFEVIERNDNDIVDEPVTNQTEIKLQQPAKKFSNGSDEYKLDEVVVKKKVRGGDETWNFLFNTTGGVQFADLIPVTLKANMFLIKKLIVECYSDLDGTDSRGNSINCLKKITFKVLDRAVESDVVKITDSVSLVKDNNTAVDRFSSSRSASDDDSNWFSNFLEKLQKLFSTHSLKVQLVNPRETEKFQVEGRRRHRFRRVFPVVAGIYMTITAVIIPIVFQFMAMMGGKSFVVSKLALLFALFRSFTTFFTPPIDTSHHHQHHNPVPVPLPIPPPIPYPHYPYDHHHAKRKSDKRFKRLPIAYNYSYYLAD